MCSISQTDFATHSHRGPHLTKSLNDRLPYAWNCAPVELSVLKSNLQRHHSLSVPFHIFSSFTEPALFESSFHWPFLQLSLLLISTTVGDCGGLSFYLSPVSWNLKRRLELLGFRKSSYLKFCAISLTRSFKAMVFLSKGEVMFNNFNAILCTKNIINRPTKLSTCCASSANLTWP